MGSCPETSAASGTSEAASPASSPAGSVPASAATSRASTPEPKVVSRRISPKQPQPGVLQLDAANLPPLPPIEELPAPTFGLTNKFHSALSWAPEAVATYFKSLDLLPSTVAKTTECSYWRSQTDCRFDSTAFVIARPWGEQEPSQAAVHLGVP